MNTFSALISVLAMWSAVTVLLIVLALHRTILGFREEGHIFVGGEGSILQQEETDALRRIAHVDHWIVRLAWISGVLLLLAAVIWLYPGVSVLF